MKLLFTFFGAFFFLSQAEACLLSVVIIKHLWLKALHFLSEDMCGEGAFKAHEPNAASQLSACYVCASYTVLYIYRKALVLLSSL